MGVLNFTGHGANVVGSLGSGSLVQDMPTALEFNGTDAYAQGSTTMSTVTGNTGTLAMWVYYTGTQTEQGEKMLFSDSNSSEARKIIMQTRNYSNHGSSFRFGWVDSAGFGISAKETGGINGLLISGTWQHMAMTFDGTDVTLFKDGVQISDGTAGTGVSYAIANPTIGRMAHDASRYFPGYIRDVQVYNVDSDAAQLGQIMNGEFPHGTPIHWWTLDDGATNDDGSATDSDLTLYNTVEDNSFYNLNQIGSGSVSGATTISGGTWNLRDSTYLNFDETGDYIDVGDNANLEVDGITLSGWFWMDSTKSGADFLACNSDGGNAGWRLYANGTDLFFCKDTNCITVDITDLMDQWVHITASYATTNMNVYINGSLHTNRADITGHLTYPTCTFDIGADGQRPTAGNLFKGNVRDVSFYDGVLTASQVDLLYKGQWTGAPLGWWKLNEGSDATATDSGTGNNDGTIEGTAGWVNPTYTYGTGKLDINSGTILSAPRGDFVFGPATFQNASDGTYTHNNGNFVLPVGSHYIQGNGNTTFYDVSGTGTGYSHFLIYTSGQTKTIEHDIMEGAGNDTIIKMVGPATKLILGTDSYASQMNCAYFDGTSGVIQYVYGANKLFPAVIGSGVYPRFLGKNGGSTYMATNAHIKWLDVQADIELPDASKFLILDGDVEFAAVTVEANQTLDLNGQRVEFGGYNQVINNGTINATGALMSLAYFNGTGVFTNDANTNVIYSNCEGSRGGWRFAPNVSGTSMINDGMTHELGYDTTLSKLILGDTSATGFKTVGYDFTLSDMSISAGQTIVAGSSTINLSDTFNMAGGFIGKSAVTFDGASGYISASSGDIDNLFDGGATAEFWINAAGGGEGGAGRIIDKYAGTMTLHVVDGSGVNKLQFQQKFGDNDGVWITDDEVITDDKWHHVALTYNNSADTNDPIIYVDGKKVAITETSIPDGTRDSDGGGPMYFGNTSAGDKTFDGMMAMVRFWNVIRTEAQLRTEMFNNYASLTSDTGLILMYQFDEATDSTILNVADEGNGNGTMSSAAWVGPGTFQYDTSTLVFDNDGGTCILYGEQDGTNTEMYALTVADGTTLTMSGTNDFWIRGPLVNSGTAINPNKNVSYYWGAAPIVGASSDLTINNKIFYYQNGGTCSGAATAYSNLRPTSDSILWMQGDFSATANMLPQGGSTTHFNGYKGTMGNMSFYNDAHVVLDAGSSINFTSTSGFNRLYGGNKDYSITASGVAATMFTDGRDIMYIGAGVSGTYNALGDHTFSCWAKLNPPSTIAGIITKGWTGVDISYYIQATDGTNKVAWATRHSGVDKTLSTATAVADGTWHHLGFTFDTSDGYKKIYVDGVISASSNTAGAGNLDSADELFGLGSWFSGPTTNSSQNYGIGMLRSSLADVRVWDGTILTDANMVTLAAINPATNVSGAYADNPSDPSSWWKLGNTGSGLPAIDLNDYGTNGYDAVMTGSSASPAGMKSGFVTITGSAGFKPMTNICSGMALTNTYVSGMQDLLVGGIDDGSSAIVAYPAQILTTKGTVTLD